MPTEGAQNISQLDPDNPGSLAPAGEGDDHLRMLKEVLQASFPALDGLISNALGDGTAGNTDPPDAATWSRLFTNAFSAFNQKVPVGGIIMWAGTEASIPTGWAICDGQNGTPDLRDRFILSVSDSGQTYAIGQFGGQAFDTTSLAFPTLKTTESPDPTSLVNADSATTTEQNNNQTHGHWYLPPFYALAFIQYQGT